MRKHQLLLFGGLAFCAAAMLAQTLPSTTFPPAERSGYRGIYGGDRPQWEAERRRFYLGGREYLCGIYPEKNTLGPKWESSSPLPIGLAKAEEIARSELRKLVAEEPRWVVTDFQISRFGHRPNWYYAVTLKPELEAVGVRSESFTVLVDFSGKAGLIGRLAVSSAHP